MKKEIKEEIIEIIDDLMPRKIDLPIKYLNLANGQDKYMSDIADQILEVIRENLPKERIASSFIQEVGDMRGGIERAIGFNQALAEIKNLLSIGEEGEL